MSTSPRPGKARSRRRLLWTPPEIRRTASYRGVTVMVVAEARRDNWVIEIRKPDGDISHRAVRASSLDRRQRDLFEGEA